MPNRYRNHNAQMGELSVGRSQLAGTRRISVSGVHCRDIGTTIDFLSDATG
jgi:hypothetical protein